MPFQHPNDMSCDSTFSGVVRGTQHDEATFLGVLQLKLVTTAGIFDRLKILPISGFALVVALVLSHLGATSRTKGGAMVHVKTGVTRI